MLSDNSTPTKDDSQTNNEVTLEAMENGESFSKLPNSVHPSVSKQTLHQSSVVPVAISFKDLSYTVKISEKCERTNRKVKVSKQILRPTSGVIQPGEVCAIMGPSGSGKTTLLDTLASRLSKDKMGGTVMLNGQVVKRGSKKLMSYVAQEDTLMGQFTVKETMRFAARFYYGYSVCNEELSEQVDAVIDHMGLTAAKETLVGDIFRKGISGGQKRRLSIAVELISQPSIVILDECTSGLDSASSYAVIKHLKELAKKKNHTVVTTIHQPSSEVWGMFDKFMLLSRGHTLYFGPASTAIKYFSRLGYECPQYSNPADFLISIVNTDFVEFATNASPEDLGEKFLNSEEFKAVSQDVEQLTKQSAPITAAVSNKKLKNHAFFVDFLVLSKRNLLNNARNPGIFMLRFAMYVMLSLMIGVMYLDLGDSFGQADINSRVSVLFFVAAFLVFMSVAVIPFMIIERATFLRESLNGTYGTFAYVISNFVCALPGLFLIALASGASVVLISGMNNFAVYVLILFLSLMVAESFMNLVASIAPHYIVGIALAAGVFGFFMLCEGFFIVKDKIPDYLIWGYYLGFHTYSFRSFMFNEFNSIEKFDIPDCAQFSNGKDVLKFYGMQDVVIWHDMLVLVGWAGAVQLCFYSVLRFVWGTGKR